MAEPRESYQIDDATLIFKNFAGRASQFNGAGDRNFCILLRPEDETALTELGYNVKYTNPREEGDQPNPYIQVKVSYNTKPPRIVTITSVSKSRTNIGQDEVEVLDYADIINVDLIFRPYDWEVRGDSGRTAYLKTMFVTIDEDPLEARYGISDSTGPISDGS